MLRILSGANSWPDDPKSSFAKLSIELGRLCLAVGSASKYRTYYTRKQTWQICKCLNLIASAKNKRREHVTQFPCALLRASGESGWVGSSACRYFGIFYVRFYVHVQFNCLSFFSRNVYGHGNRLFSRTFVSRKTTHYPDEPPFSTPLRRAR